MTNRPIHNARRRFLFGGATGLAAAGLSGTTATAGGAASEPYCGEADIKIAGYDYDRIRAIQHSQVG